MRSTGADKYNLNLPEYDDAADVEVLNTSTETIAATLKEVDDESAGNKAAIASLQSSLTGSGGLSSQVSGIQSAVSDMTSQLAAVASQASDNAVQINSISNKAFSGSSSLSAQLASIQSQLSSLQSTLNKVDRQINSGYNGQASILSRLNSLDGSVSAAQSSANAAANAAANANDNATADVSAGRLNGVVKVANGGTGTTSITRNGVMLGNGANAVTTLATEKAGALYQAGGGAAPVVGTLLQEYGGTGTTSAAAFANNIAGTVKANFPMARNDSNTTGLVRARVLFNGVHPVKAKGSDLTLPEAPRNFDLLFVTFANCNHTNYMTNVFNTRNMNGDSANKHSHALTMTIMGGSEDTRSAIKDHSHVLQTYSCRIDLGGTKVTFGDGEVYLLDGSGNRYTAKAFNGDCYIEIYQIIGVRLSSDLGY